MGTEMIVFTKYVERPVAEEDEDADDEAPLLEGKAPPSRCTAWLRRRPTSRWEQLWYFLRWSTPKEGDLWIRIDVKPMTKNYSVDNGEVRSRPVNVVDCHAATASFVNPFIRLYQVSPSGKTSAPCYACARTCAPGGCMSWKKVMRHVTAWGGVVRCRTTSTTGSRTIRCVDWR